MGFHGKRATYVLLVPLLALLLVVGIKSDNNYDPCFCNMQVFSSQDPARLYFGVVLDDLVNSMRRAPYWLTATKNIRSPRRQPLVYGFANCTETRGSSNEDTCYECLRKVKRVILETCPHRVGANYRRNVCYMRYEVYDFLS